MKTSLSYNDAKRYVRSLSTVRYIEERPFMIAIVELSSDTDRPLVAKGLSTCSPTDHWDSKRGQDIAKGRAEAKLARRVMQTAKEVKFVSKPIAVKINSK